MGAYWRGEISARRLRVLVEGLPANSARARAYHEGRQWTVTDALLWQAVYYLRVLDQRLVWHRGKRAKWPKFSEFPWSRSDVQLGNRGDATTEQVLAYLESIAPPKRK
ncbi:hypothetical protein ACH47B_06525 [Rhodococcus sp. NPDC019627]|uniref:hypothetical protein n=1 Tax=unclassified Rhodococcus (in: high G+C Gram-positive bacteria) TaxID=192944 RepID=UPI0037B2AF8B